LEKRIPLMKAEFLLVYNCHSCGEKIYLDQRVLNYLIERKLRKPTNCSSCGRRKPFTLNFEESAIGTIMELKEEKTE